MLKSEFEKLTSVEVSYEQYAEIEKEYMNSPLDKFSFCGKYVKKLNDEKVSKLTGDYKKAFELVRNNKFASVILDNDGVLTPYERYTKDGMKTVIDSANDGNFTEDDTLIIEYTDGTSLYYNGEEELDTKIKKSNLKAVIYLNDATEAFYGDCVIVNYKDLFLNQETDDWRVILKSEIGDLLDGIESPYYNLLKDGLLVQRRSL